MRLSAMILVVMMACVGQAGAADGNVIHHQLDKGQPGPRVPVPWIVDTAVASQDVGSLKDGDVQALDSQFKLKNGLVGSLL
ncbi:MAG: hypothetical protein ACOH1P_06430 [Lysobacter sp.]